MSPLARARAWMARVWRAPRHALVVALAAFGIVALSIDLVLVVANTSGDAELTRMQGEAHATPQASAAERTADARFPVPGSTDAAVPPRVTLHYVVDVPETGRTWAVLVEHPQYTAEVSWDGHPAQLATTDPRTGQAVPGDSALFFVPSELATAGEHAVEITVTGDFSATGLLGNAYAGPARWVQDRHSRAEFQRVAMSATLLAAALVWLAIALIRPSRTEFLWGGLLWGSLGVHYFTWTTAWSLAFPDLTLRLQVRDSAGAAACANALLFTARFSPSWRRVRAAALAFCGMAYLVAQALPWHRNAPLDQAFAVAYAILSITLCTWWYIDGIRRGDRVARALFVANLPAVALYASVAATHRTQAEQMVLPALVVFMVCATIVLVVRHADLADRYERLFARARDAVLVVERDGRVRDVNPRARALFPASAPGASLMDSLASDAVANVTAYLRSRADGRRLDLPARQGDDVRVVETVATDLEDETVLLTGRDVTGRANAERSLVHVARLETVGLLATGLVHDFNNALTVLLSHVDTLRAEATPRDAERLERLGRTVLRAGRMGRQIASIMREGPAVPGPQDLEAITRDTLHWLEGILVRPVPIRLEVQGPLPVVHAARPDLEQLVLNLVNNAIEASPADGQVRISLRRSTQGGEPCALLVVEDDGPGVPPEIRERIWEPFYTTRADGHGIGLSVVARTVRDLGGSVRVNAASSGKGARFEIALPARHPMVHRRARAGLVADSARRIPLAAMLEERGFQVEPVAPSAPSEVDVVILDAHDDEGLAAAQAWIARHGNARLVVLRPAGTGYAPLDARVLAGGPAPEALATAVRAVMLGEDDLSP